MKRLWLAGVVLLALISGIGGYTWWHSAATTTASVQPSPVNTLVLGSETSLQAWQTTLFSTQRPGDWHQLQSTENPAGPILATYLLAGSGQNRSDQLAVTIGKLGNNALSEISAVRVRQSQPDTYTPVQLSYAPAGAIGFTAGTQYETGVFWQHESNYVAVVVSGAPQHKAALNQALQDIVAHWTWQ